MLVRDRDRNTKSYTYNDVSKRETESAAVTAAKLTLMKITYLQEVCQYLLSLPIFHLIIIKLLMCGESIFL